ncbi:MAG: NHL repeat-containing protein [Candidatus Dormibacteria bacterium]
MTLRRFPVRAAVALAVALALDAASVVSGGAKAPPPTGCFPTACIPGTTVGLSDSKGNPVPAAAGLYAWGAATEPDGSILVGDYWNYRIVHYNASGSQASPFVFTKSKVGFGTDTNQQPFGICVDNSRGTFQGYVYMTEGSLYNVIQYDPSGNWVTNWGTTHAAHSAPFQYPSQCAVGSNGLVYISNQWGTPNKSLQGVVILNPSTGTTTVVQGPTSPKGYTFVQPRGLAFDSAGNIWIANQGQHKIDIYTAGCLQNPWPSSGCLPLTRIAPPGGVTSTFDMRGLAIDTVNKVAFVANGQGCVVQEFNADPSSSSFGSFIANFNGTPVGGRDCGTGNGEFEDGARNIAVDMNHHVWVGDLGNFRAQVFDESGNFLSAVPNPPAPPPTGGFNGPRGAAFDSAGDMYVSDMYNERVEEFAPNGSGGYVFDRVWGERGDSPATFNYPRLMCIDPASGDLVVANTDSNIIVAWKVSVNPPSVDWSSSTGSPPAGTLADPYGVACASDGTIYVANSNAKDVAVFDSTGNQLGAMGSSNSLGFTRGIWVDSADGSVWVDCDATGKVFHFAPWSAGGTLLGSFDVNTSIAAAGVFGIAGDAGYLYIALSSVNEVAQYTRAGALVGTFGGYGVTVGKMRTPQGLAFGPAGRLYVVEENTNRVSQWSVP